jgi:neutral ceramidase
MTFKAGTAKIVITPPVGVELAGYSFGPSQGVLADLEAQALVLESATEKATERAVLLSVDLLVCGAELVAGVRQRVEAELGIPGSHVNLAASHTHSGPTTMPFRQWGALDKTYLRWLESSLVGAVKMAQANLQEARLGMALGKVESISENRRGKPPLDVGLPLLRLDRLDGRPLCILYNFCCHPVVLHSYRNLISPDYPGYARKAVKAVLGEDTLVMFTLGTAGDINPAGYRPRRFNPEDARRMGTILGCEVARRALEIEYENEPTLLLVQRELALPVEALPKPEALSDLLAGYESQAQNLRMSGAAWEEIAVWEIQRDWALDGLMAWERHSVQDSQSCELTALRLGQAALIFAPLELFTETGLAVKAQSPAQATLVCSNSNGGLGYLPTADAYHEADYTNPQGLAPKVYGIYAFSPQAEPLFRSQAVQLIQGLFSTLP